MIQGDMTDGLAELTERPATLPETEREQWLDRFVHEIDQSANVHRLSEEERTLVVEGIADLNAGRIVGGDRLEAFWDRNKRP